MFKKQKGFTLIELLVVIAIIGLLAGIVLVSLGGARTSAQDARRQADIRQVGTAMELYYNDNTSVYPTDAGTGTPSRVDASIKTALIDELPTFPTDPSGVEYRWIDNTAGNQGYCIFAEMSGGSFFVSDPGGARDFGSTAPTTITNNLCA